MKINFSIPVELYDFRESDNSLYSYAKLKIFYLGETPDKRLFTKDFSDKLLETLPYVPVVGYFDEDEEDFVGHNSEVQHIYGLVPEDTAIDYVKENGKKYAICDVILYTGRKDKTGQIAQKIVGKAHSLELNPDNTTYTVNKDEEGNFINIEFKTGTLLGLSILGDGEKPAFTGSEFFTEKEFQEEIFKNLREFISSKQKRGEEMNFNKFDSALEFIKKSYSEKIDDLVDVLREHFGDYFYVEQLFDDYVVVTTFDWDTGVQNHVRASYGLVDDKYEILEQTSVIKRFLTEKEVKKWEEFMSFEANLINVEEYKINSWDEGEDLENINSAEENEEVEYIDAEEIAESINVGTQTSDKTNNIDAQEIAEDCDESTKTNEGDENGDDFEEALSEENNEAEEELDSETFTESEREELEALRREVYGYRKEAKLGLLQSFEDDLSSDFIENLKNELDNYDYESLEIELSKEFTRITRESRPQKQSKFMPFAHNGKTNINTTSDKNEYIKRLVETHK